MHSEEATSAEAAIEVSIRGGVHSQIVPFKIEHHCCALTKTNRNCKCHILSSRELLLIMLISRWIYICINFFLSAGLLVKSTLTCTAGS